jgi:hypothetical protein
MVYAASLDPDGLLVNADALLLSKHQFVVTPPDSRKMIFPPAALEPSHDSAGAHLTGGFMNLDDLGKGFARAGRSVARSAPRAADSGSLSSAASSGTILDLLAPQADFKTTDGLWRLRDSYRRPGTLRG